MGRKFYKTTVPLGEGRVPYRRPAGGGWRFESRRLPPSRRWRSARGRGSRIPNRRPGAFCRFRDAWRTLIFRMLGTADRAAHAIPPAFRWSATSKCTTAEPYGAWPATWSSLACPRIDPEPCPALS